MVEKKKITYIFKESNKQSKSINDKIKSDLVIAVYDVNGNTIHKAD